MRRNGNLADRRDGHGDSGTRFSLTYSAGPSALRRLRPVMRPVRPMRPRRRVQPPLRRSRAARPAHEPRVMVDLQCNVHSTFCIQYRVGVTASQAGSDQKHRYRRKRNSISKQKSSMSYTDIEGAFIDIVKSLMLGYNDIDVLNFDIDVASTSCCVDIEVPDFDIDVSST
jgi:hypothetical protein